MTTETLTPSLADEAAKREVVRAERNAAFEKCFGGNYMERFTDPIHFLSVGFLNYRIHKFYENNYAFMSKNLFSEYVYRRRAKYNRDLLVRYFDLMAKKLGGVSAILTKYHGQVDHVLKVNNQTDDEIGYLREYKELVPVIHAQARQYLDLLLSADQLFMKLAAGVLSGLIDSNEKTEIERKVILSFRAIGNTVRNEAITLRKEATRVRNEMQSEGIHDEELDSAIDTQTRAAAEGAVVEKNNAKIDGVAFTDTPAMNEFAQEQAAEATAA
ncbi:hypothetical protein V8Z74_14920 [Comamonas sp. w2-DMI]|uniref:hypothetical protein n=1 Tax=Comamonas sp. w2-DMI TaxID=3126391 RepID=UPI0032E436F0